MKIVICSVLVSGLLLTVMGEEFPAVIQAAAPGYPRQRPPDAQLEGEVEVDMILAPDGSVIEAHAISGPVMLRPVAERTAGGWRFAPNQRDKARIVFAFILQGGLADPPAVASIFKPPNRLEVFAMKRDVIVISDPPVEEIKKQKKPRAQQR